MRIEAHQRSVKCIRNVSSILFLPLSLVLSLHNFSMCFYIVENLFAKTQITCTVWLKCQLIKSHSVQFLLCTIPKHFGSKLASNEARSP